MTETVADAGRVPQSFNPYLDFPGHPELARYFSVHSGPGGKVPVQLIGTLASGEYVYFRARGLKATLEIAQSEADWSDDRLLAKFSKEVEYDPENPFGLGVMEFDEAVELIKPWLDAYLGSK